MQQAVDLLGNPEKSYPIIHVTGTNGKGSTIAFMRELFMGHGKKLRLSPPPHIVSINDRICINGKPIADADFIRLANKVKEMEKTLLQNPWPVVFFELLTLIAFLYFREQAVDLVLLEVGIGGLLRHDQCGNWRDCCHHFHRTWSSGDSGWQYSSNCRAESWYFKAGKRQWLLSCL